MTTQNPNPSVELQSVSSVPDTGEGLSAPVATQQAAPVPATEVVLDMKHSSPEKTEVEASSVEDAPKAKKSALSSWIRRNLGIEADLPAVLAGGGSSSATPRRVDGNTAAEATMYIASTEARITTGIGEKYPNSMTTSAISLIPLAATFDIGTSTSGGDRASFSRYITEGETALQTLGRSMQVLIWRAWTIPQQNLSQEQERGVWEKIVTGAAGIMKIATAMGLQLPLAVLVSAPGRWVHRVTSAAVTKQYDEATTGMNALHPSIAEPAKAIRKRGAVLSGFLYWLNLQLLTLPKQAAEVAISTIGNVVNVSNGLAEMTTGRNLRLNAARVMDGIARLVPEVVEAAVLSQVISSPADINPFEMGKFSSLIEAADDRDEHAGRVARLFVAIVSYIAVTALLLGNQGWRAAVSMVEGRWQQRSEARAQEALMAQRRQERQQEAKAERTPSRPRQARARLDEEVTMPSPSMPAAPSPVAAQEVTVASTASIPRSGSYVTVMEGIAPAAAAPAAGIIQDPAPSTLPTEGWAAPDVDRDAHTWAEASTAAENWPTAPAASLANQGFQAEAQRAVAAQQAATASAAATQSTAPALRNTSDADAVD